ncbi:hypothetical protein GCM10009555_097560 [Acrocarpospora macrocephala]|uniref:Uncharacterized protein n=1 Tax=Acrocarpospora macrocephala TaxID=150177 RepID=A0A5M3WWQ7_9ACTN|nr:hypothetical protein [Acrocarpospora macrocephala]GES12662.1 hypothetical protein Amac_062590 [Acrocarpospora macrocephala]
MVGHQRPERILPADNVQHARWEAARMRAGGLLDGWRYILADATLRRLLFKTALFNGLVMATGPLLAALMLGQLGFAPWQYGVELTHPEVMPGGPRGSVLPRHNGRGGRRPPGTARTWSSRTRPSPRGRSRRSSPTLGGKGCSASPGKSNDDLAHRQRGQRRPLTR